MADSTDLNGGRAKRQKLDKHGRAAAFEKLKKLKGSKHKYEDTDVNNVYDEVDEREYSKRVLERQDDDWIEDDDGAGYIEDGREIFDDDMDDEAISSATKRNSKGKPKKNVQNSSKELAAPGVKSNSIRNMFMNIPAKKKKDVKLDEDEILGDIMQELSSAPVLKPLPAIRSIPVNQSFQRCSPSIPTPHARRNVFGVNAQRSSSSMDSPSPLYPTSGSTDSSGLANGLNVTESQIIEDVESQVIPEDPPMEEIIEDMEDSLDAEDFKPIIEEMKDLEKVNIKEENVADVSEAKINGTLVSNDVKEEPWEGDTPSPVQTVLELEEGTLPLEKSLTKEGEDVLRFFWWDALEGPPGTVYLFGKVKSGDSFFSCCVTVKNLERQIYLLPREEMVNKKTGISTGEKVSMMDVYSEFNDEVATQHKIFEFKSRQVVRKYAFEHADVPLSSEYLEVRYPASHAALPRDFSGRTFSRVFGTESSFLELLLLERKIKGPCWIEVHGAEAAKSKLSWCAIEAVAYGASSITAIAREGSESSCGPTPPLTIVSLAVRTAPNNRTGLAEVILAGGVIKRGLRVDASSATEGSAKKVRDETFCIIARPDRVPWPRDCDAYLRGPGKKPVVRVDSERALLSVFLGKISSLDPDVIVGHGISDFELEVISQRLSALGVTQPSRIGRLRRGNDSRKVATKNKGSDRVYKDRFPLAGRLMCDTKISAKELIKSRTYELQPLCRKVLDGCEEENMEEQEMVDKDEVAVAFLSGASLAKFVSKVELEAHQVLRLMEALEALPLALQITNIAGNVMSRTLAGGRSERNEFLLLHAFTERGFIVPDKTYGFQGPKGEKEGAGGKGRREAAYAGGLVLEPIAGLYDTLILLMDFNSLYPSIIQEYNICFTTLPRHVTSRTGSGDDVDIQALLEMLPDADTEQGVLPSEIRKLVESRRAVKRLMAASGLTAAQRRQYDVRQMALKLTANSMYGCLGFGASRFQARELAALVTAKGREILSRTRDLVQEKLSLTVVYGDTDSVMIDTKYKGDYEGALKMGGKIKGEVNKMYRQVELEVDGVFERMLLLKKKKYAALLLEQKGQQMVRRMELKGLDIVRRDWSRISVEAGKYVVAQLLGADGQSADLDDRLSKIVSYLEALKEDLEAGKIPIHKLIITKQLTKSPETYADAKSMAHVQVALRYNAEAGTRPLLRGDTVPYVICEDGTKNSSAQRAYHPEELTKRQLSQDSSMALSVDIHYYLAQQIHPVVSRLCQPIPGMDANRIAVCLGLDPVFTQRPVLPSDGICNSINFDVGPKVDFRECERFQFTCMNDKCRAVNEVDGPYRNTASGRSFVLESCCNPDCTTSPLKYLSSIQNALILAIRRHIDHYYAGWLICEDPGCPNRVRRIPIQVRGSYPVCSGCSSGCMMREYNETQLYTQLLYYADMFDLNKANKITGADEEKPPENIPRDIESAYSKLENQVNRILASSSYAVINLGSLFMPLKKLKI
ncbi:DNA polymerase alpha catalytic subunit [Ischnura elegans]|uniref:DNA polymerase alpha catalytic subunit n=1 Tax=Ischnura elegans TaxID=197161 RepID=UPI001ED8854C|nr:DNA polymerase alpha catalytic subunit [Ischnura elegans]